jgi:hypothetical protein
LAPKDLPKELRIPILKEPSGRMVDTGEVMGVAESAEFDK